MALSTLALVTCAEIPDLIPGDRAVAAALRALGAEVHAVVWDDPSAPWGAFDAIVVHSPWDYHLKLDAFRAWIDRLEALGAPLINPAPLLRWNLHKAYLPALRAAGCPVVDTRVFPRGDAPPLADLLRDLGWPEAVAKPAASGAGRDTFRVGGPVSPEEAAAQGAAFATLVAKEDALLQPYLPEIGPGGERSLVYFGGRYSHSVIKFARPGEFRIHEEHGGRTEAYRPEPGLIEAGAQILATAEALTGIPAFYGRVDLVMHEGAALLMELELVEPERFFNFKAGAAEAYARALLGHMGR